MSLPQKVFHHRQISRTAQGLFNPVPATAFINNLYTDNARLVPLLPYKHALKGNKHCLGHPKLKHKYSMGKGFKDSPQLFSEK
jgi:hypothetical protein